MHCFAEQKRKQKEQHIKYKRKQSFFSGNHSEYRIWIKVLVKVHELWKQAAILRF